MQSIVRFRTRTWLLLLFGLAFFYFYSGGGPNQGTRFNLDRAILEQGRVQTDSYHNNSEDKARYRGHYYCDKAPGSSLAALGPLAAARVAMKFVGLNPNTAEAALVGMHVATWTVAGVPALILCLLVFTWLRRRGRSTVSAVCAAMAVGLASPMWAYATLFWGNALASCCLVVAAYSVDRLVHSTPLCTEKSLPLLAGLATGGAVVTEYPTAPMAAFLALWLLWHLRPWALYWHRLALYGVGALTMAAILGSYNYVAFGSPFHLGYASVEGFEGMKKGVFGVTWPGAEAIAGVTWGPRGLLITAPVLVLGLIGHIVALVRKQQRKTTIVCLVCSIYPYLLNVSYVYWDGGWTYGPRHMATAFPFLAMGIAPLYDTLRKKLPASTIILLALLMTGIFFTFVAVSVHGMTPYVPKEPFFHLYWRSFLFGQFAKHRDWLDAGGPATNLGLALGMKPQYSVIPFVLGFLGLLSGLVQSLRRPLHQQ